MASSISFTVQARCFLTTDCRNPKIVAILGEIEKHFSFLFFFAGFVLVVPFFHSFSMFSVLFLAFSVFFFLNSDLFLQFSSNSAFLSLSCSFFPLNFQLSFLPFSLGIPFIFLSVLRANKQASKHTNKQTSTWQTMTKPKNKPIIWGCFIKPHIYHPFMIILGRIFRSLHQTRHHITQLWFVGYFSGKILREGSYLWLSEHRFW